MDKKVIIAHAAAMLAASVALAGQEGSSRNARAIPQPSTGAHMAYGCIGSGDGDFEGRVSCEGRIVGSCEAGGSCAGNISRSAPARPRLPPPVIPEQETKNNDIAQPPVPQKQGGQGAVPSKNSEGY